MRSWWRNRLLRQVRAMRREMDALQASSDFQSGQLELERRMRRNAEAKADELQRVLQRAGVVLHPSFGGPE